MPETPSDYFSDEDEEEEEECEHEAPCRAAARIKTECPQRGRRMSVKTLRYTHVCGRSFDVLQRALEQKKLADAALKARMASA
jgi:hypothetical protein